MCVATRIMLFIYKGANGNDSDGSKFNRFPRFDFDYSSNNGRRRRRGKITCGASVKNREAKKILAECVS
jgi:hypothetical protein